MPCTEARAGPPRTKRTSRANFRTRRPVQVVRGGWLPTALQGELDMGQVVAMGVPMTVTLLSPLWVVNATNLAIDAAIVQVPPPPPVSSHSGMSAWLQSQLMQCFQSLQ